MKWLKRGSLLLLLFIFCADIDTEREVKPFVMPLLPQERGKPASQIEGDGSLVIEDYDNFVRTLSKEKLERRDYMKLDWDSALYKDN